MSFNNRVIDAVYKLKSDKEKLKVENDGLRVQNGILSDEKEILNISFSSLRTEMEGVTAEKEYFYSMYLKIQEERDALRTENESLKAENESLKAENELFRLKKENESLKAEKTELIIKMDVIIAQNEKFMEIYGALDGALNEGEIDENEEEEEIEEEENPSVKDENEGEEVEEENPSVPGQVEIIRKGPTTSIIQNALYYVAEVFKRQGKDTFTNRDLFNYGWETGRMDTINSFRLHSLGETKFYVEDRFKKKTYSGKTCLQQAWSDITCGSQRLSKSGYFENVGVEGAPSYRLVE